MAKRTIQRYMREERLGRPASQNWATFLKTHATDVWACDFMQVIDLLFRQFYVFFIVELETRRVVHFGVTRQPSQFRVAQQLREATPNGEKPRFILRDNDNKYGSAFDIVAKATGIEVLRTPCRAPRANSIAERFVGSVRRECLDHLLIFGDRQLRRVIAALYWLPVLIQIASDRKHVYVTGSDGLSENRAGRINAVASTGWTSVSLSVYRLGIATDIHTSVGFLRTDYDHALCRAFATATTMNSPQES